MVAVPKLQNLYNSHTTFLQRYNLQPVGLYLVALIIYVLYSILIFNPVSSFLASAAIAQELPNILITLSNIISWIFDPEFLVMAGFVYFLRFQFKNSSKDEAQDPRKLDDHEFFRNICVSFILIGIIFTLKEQVFLIVHNIRTGEVLFPLMFQGNIGVSKIVQLLSSLLLLFLGILGTISLPIIFLYFFLITRNVFASYLGIIVYIILTVLIVSVFSLITYWLSERYGLGNNLFRADQGFFNWLRYYAVPIVSHTFLLLPVAGIYFLYRKNSEWYQQQMKELFLVQKKSDA